MKLLILSYFIASCCGFLRFYVKCIFGQKFVNLGSNFDQILWIFGIFDILGSIFGQIGTIFSDNSKNWPKTAEIQRFTLKKYPTDNLIWAIFAYWVIFWYILVKKLYLFHRLFQRFEIFGHFRRCETYVYPIGPIGYRGIRGDIWAQKVDFPRKNQI